MEIKKIFGIYHANGGMMGDLSYLAGKIFANRHCTLCDITHRMAWKKKEWSECEVSFELPISLLHLNERTPALREFTEGKTPCVVGETDAGFVTLLDADMLASFGGSVDDFSSGLKAALEREA